MLEASYVSVPTPGRPEIVQQHTAHPASVLPPEIVTARPLGHFVEHGQKRVLRVAREEPHLPVDEILC